MELIVSSPERLSGVSTNGTLLRLFAYWVEKRGSRPFPARDDLDLLEFTYALSRVSLVDVLQNPQSFHYRLVSTSLTDRLGYEMTGKSVDDIPEDSVRRYVEDFYTRAVDTRAPLYEKSTRLFQNRIWQHEALVLPLSPGADFIDMLMIYRETYDPKPLSPWARDDRELSWV